MPYNPDDYYQNEQTDDAYSYNSEAYDEDAYDDNAYLQMDEPDMTDNDIDWYDTYQPYQHDDPVTPEEQKMRILGRYRLAAGMVDFVMVIVGIIVIFVFLLLAVSLFQWLRSDVVSSYNQLLSGV